VAATGEVLVITKNGQPVAELHACAPARRASPSDSIRACDDKRRSARSDRQRLGGPGVIVLDTHGLLWLDREDPARAKRP
jgi:antitoxin (DNA-binding transcriptional repressor) of toxin-antitoxin stability system